MGKKRRGIQTQLFFYYSSVIGMFRKAEILKGSSREAFIDQKYADVFQRFHLDCPASFQGALFIQSSIFFLYIVFVSW